MDKYAYWPDGTVAELSDVRRGDYDWKSDDYSVVTYDEAIEMGLDV